jgi:hypothetical protein
VSTDRDRILAEFEAARAAFEGVISAAPEAALRHCPEGEDYSLGGLVVHVQDVLSKYAEVLRQIRAASFGTVHEAPHSPTEPDAALIRDGFSAAQRAGVLENMRSAHQTLLDQVQRLPADDFQRAAPVYYAGSTEPYETTPAAVVGWVTDHYNEHVEQVRGLLSTWRAPD